MSALRGDGGLQAERTALAWRRTTLSSACVTAIFLHHAAGERRDFVTVAPVLAATAASAVLALTSRTRERSLREGVSSMTGTRGLAVALAVVGCAAAAILTTLR